MTFQVFWKPAAEDDLARIWISAPDQGDVARAADSIDEELRRDPIACSESRAQGTRVLLNKPLGVHFQIDPMDRKVFVLEVWYIRTKR
jgi:hypothetical protein